MIRFYAPDIETEGRLPEQESAHCCRVLRLREGDRIYAIDGKGYSYECLITDAHPKGTTVEILSRSEEPQAWTPRITLAVAPTKNIDRMEWLVEKAVEMGVDRIVFLQCARSERKVLKRERIAKIAISAMTQSLKATLPEISELTGFKDFIKSCDTPVRVMGYCDKDYPRKEFARNYDGKQDITILIGPEGDFSPEEVKLAVECGFQPVTFGNTRLRTETAALYAVAAVHVLDNLTPIACGVE